MVGYYAAKLSAERLRRCYEVATPRVRQYLEAETQFVLEHLDSDDDVLELGCGYGRVTSRLAEIAGRAVGIDTSLDSIDLAVRLRSSGLDCEYALMDAVRLGLRDACFDSVSCWQ